MDARFVLLRLQAQGDHSEAELRAQLERRGYSALEIEDALNWGRDHAAVDDARAKDTLVERQLRKGRGPLRIEAELERKGLDSAVDVPDARERATKLLSMQLVRFAKDPIKAASWLARQGYDEDTVRAAVEALIGPLD